MTVEYYNRDPLVSTGLIKIKKTHILGDVGLQYFFENVPTISYSFVQLS